MSNGAQSALVRNGAIASLAVLIVFLAAWQWGPGLLGIPSFIVPPLSMVGAEFLHAWQFDHLLFHTGVTVAEVMAGFVLGSLLGAAVGYLLGLSPIAEFALSPYILALQIAPKVAFAPLFILWMGFTVYPKILVAILIVFFPVMVNVLTAVRGVDPDLVNLARAFKATRAQIFWKIEFPTSMPPMFAGLRIGSTLAVVGVVVGELVGGNHGARLSAHFRRRPGRYAAGVRLDRDADLRRRHRLSRRHSRRAPRVALSAGPIAGRQSLMQILREMLGVPVGLKIRIDPAVDHEDAR